MSRTLARKAALSLVAGLVASTAAQAQDQINFEGAAQVANAADAHLLALDFLTATLPSPGRPGTITATETADGVFAAGGVVPGVTLGTIADLTFAATGVAHAPLPPFVTLGAYTFSLVSTPLASGPTPPSFGPVQLTQLGTSRNTVAAFAVDGVVTAGPAAVGRAYTGISRRSSRGRRPGRCST